MTKMRPRAFNVGPYVRWAKRTPAERSAFAKRMRKQKGQKHATVTQLAIGHYRYMALCRRYQRQYRRKLTPAERAWIRTAHKAEIDADKIGSPWPKRERVWFGPPDR